MENYKREFIKFLEGAGVLKFGDFTAKSGRKIPYFVNAGEIKTGEQIAKLGEFYAACYADKIGDKRTVLYGRACRDNVLNDNNFFARLWLQTEGGRRSCYR